MSFLSSFRAAAVAAVLAFAAMPALAQTTGSLTTTLTHDNAFAGNTFDLVPSYNLTINRFDVNVGQFGTTGGGAGATAKISIYWRTGTSNGFQDNPAGWTLLGTANVVSNGANIATPVPIGGLTLTAGQTYGFYVDLENYDGGNLQMLYSNGAVNYSNEDLTLTPLFGKGNPAFSASTFSPRTWNGVVHYTSTRIVTTCASEGYTGTKLTWCRNICEMGYTGAVLDTWIHRWVNRYRDLPYCAVEDEEEPPQET